MVEELSDLEVVKRIASGDKRALETLYSRHSGRTFKFLFRLTADRAAAEDLAHDVFLEVWKAANRFEARSSVTTWILSIARYKALDARRKRRTFTEHDLPGRAEPTPEMTAMESSTGNYMRECLDKLSEEHREIIDLVYYHEMSVKEAGEILGIPEATVKTRMFYARKKLKEMLQAAGDQNDAFSYR
jgi:RNA polymerase sigma-70 factor, ECF subfamily